MSVSYDVFIGSFLEKVTERDLLSLEESQRDEQSAVLRKFVNMIYQPHLMMKQENSM